MMMNMILITIIMMMREACMQWMRKRDWNGKWSLWSSKRIAMNLHRSSNRHQRRRSCWNVTEDTPWKHTECSRDEYNSRVKQPKLKQVCRRICPQNYTLLASFYVNFKSDIKYVTSSYAKCSMKDKERKAQRQEGWWTREIMMSDVVKKEKRREREI